ncbi:MAG: cell division protein, partial [Sphingobacteriales bacterium]
MDIKKDILWRVYLVFLCIIILGFAIIGKTVYIQRAEGNFWKKMSDSLHLEYRELDAERGTIYSEDGSMLSTSIPYFDVRIDFAAQGLRAKNGLLFTKNIDTLSMELAALFKDFGADYYKELLNAAYKRKDRYFLLRRNINFEQYKTMGDFHLIKEGRNKSGFIFEDKEKRLTPFGLLANRTIGLAREYRDKDG